MKMHVLFPGSFDPPTKGHLALVERAAGLFQKVTVCISVNAGKTGWLGHADRLRLMKDICGTWKNVRVISDEGLVVDCARRCGAQAIIKGLRSPVDFEGEKMMASVNNRIGQGIETIFLMARDEHVAISSSLVRQIFQLGGDLSPFVPRRVCSFLRGKS